MVYPQEEEPRGRTPHKWGRLVSFAATLPEVKKCRANEEEEETSASGQASVYVSLNLHAETFGG